MSCLRIGLTGWAAGLLALVWMLATAVPLYAQPDADCGELIDAYEQALSPLECKKINENFACYGHRNAEGTPSDIEADGVEFLFGDPGHHLPINAFNTIDTLAPDGTVLMLLRTEQDPVYFVLFGDSEIGSFSTDSDRISGLATDDEELCADTPSALLVHTDEGQEGYVYVNGVEIELSSTALVTLRGYEPSSVGGGTGRLVYYTEEDGDWEIYTMNSDGRNRRQLTDNDARDLHAAWSPDGEQMVFQSNRDGHDKLYQMDADGENVIQLTYDGSRQVVDDMHPDWSPDGSEVIFVRTVGDRSAIYALGMEGGDLRRIDPDGGSGDVRWPVWSPDNQEIAFASDVDGDWEIYVMDRDGHDVRQITDNDVIDNNPSWSPDGARIAFSSQPAERYEIHVIDSSGDNERVLTRGTSGGDWAPIWSPDGRLISFVSSSDGDNDIMIMDADGQGVRRLTRNRVRDEVAMWQPSPEPVVYEMVVANLEGNVVVEGVPLDEGEQTNITVVNELPEEIGEPEPSPYVDSEALRWLIYDPGGLDQVETPACGGPLVAGTPVVDAIEIPGQECVYTFGGEAGQRVTIGMAVRDGGIDVSNVGDPASALIPVAYALAPALQQAAQFDPWLDLRGPDDQLLTYDDNGGSGEGDSLIRDFELPFSGQYAVVARTVDKQGTGRFEISLETNSREEAVCQVVAARLNLRSGPGTAYDPPITVVTRGTRLLPLARNNASTWIRVEVESSGITGWVSAGTQYVECGLEIGSLPVEASGPVETPQPVVTPTPPATPPATPPRSVNPTPTFTPVPTRAPEPPGGPDVVYLPPPEIVVAGDCQSCAEFSWDVRNISALYLNGGGMNGQGSTSICMAEGDRSELLSGMWGAITYPYQFQILSDAGEFQYSTDVVFTYPLVQFWADNTSIEQGSCTTVRWNVDGAQAVYFGGEGVAGYDSREVCPYDPTTYQLDVAGQCLTSQYYVSIDTQASSSSVEPTPTMVPPPPEVLGSPDLVTSVNDFSLACESSTVCYGDVYFSVANNGDAASAGFYVHVAAESAAETDVAVDGLAAGEGLSLSIRIGPVDSCYNPDCTITAWADWYGYVAESNEDNNGSQRTDPGIYLR